jgi:hypothetical protein
MIRSEVRRGFFQELRLQPLTLPAPDVPETIVSGTLNRR